MSKTPATVHFTSGGEGIGGEAVVENVTWKEGGWVGLLADDGWVYYPPRHIDRIVSKK